MEVQEIVGRAVAWDMENDDDGVLELLTETILYFYTEDLMYDMPLEEFEETIITHYEGDVPEEIDQFLDSMDEPWSAKKEVLDNL